MNHLTGPQWAVVFGYLQAFASRGLYTALHPVVGTGPYLFSDGSPIRDKRAHCYWVVDDVAGVPSNAADCSWIWHHGPGREVVSGDSRVMVIPRNDLFEIRGIQNDPASWEKYRSLIRIPWAAKLNELHFVGHFTGPADANNSRLRACQLLKESGMAVSVGLLGNFIPQQYRHLVVVKDPEPLQVMAQYRFVLSLWGNHPFNPRLYRGLEAGSLVFHQATPTVRLLEDGILCPAKHYVEIAPDLSDLVEKVHYFMNHPVEARDIAEEGHKAWMTNFYVRSPYTLSDAIWERLTSQPRWSAFRAACDVHW